MNGKYGDPMARFHDATCNRYASTPGVKCIPRNGFMEIVQEVATGQGVTRKTLAHVLPKGNGIIMKMEPVVA